MLFLVFTLFLLCANVIALFNKSLDDTFCIDLDKLDLDKLDLNLNLNSDLDNSDLDKLDNSNLNSDLDNLESSMVPLFLMITIVNFAYFIMFMPIGILVMGILIMCFIFLSRCIRYCYYQVKYFILPLIITIVNFACFIMFRPIGILIMRIPIMGFRCIRYQLKYTN